MKPLAWLIVLSPVFALADEELIGVWEAVYSMDDLFTDEPVMEATIRFTFKTDNRFELHQNIVLPNQDLPAGDGEFEVQIDRDLVVLGSGTYRTAGDSLFLDVTEVDETLNRDSLAAILTLAGQWLAHHMAKMTGYWPEDWAAYEEGVVAELIGNFERTFFFVGHSGLVGTYRIEHGRLWVFDTLEDGTVALREFIQRATATAVTSSTWAAVKKKFQ